MLPTPGDRKSSESDELMPVSHCSGSAGAGGVTGTGECPSNGSVAGMDTALASLNCGRCGVSDMDSRVGSGSSDTGESCSFTDVWSIDGKESPDVSGTHNDG